MVNVLIPRNISRPGRNHAVAASIGPQFHKETGGQEHQLLAAPPNGLSEAGPRPASTPKPTRTFMSGFHLDWEDGIKGSSGVLESHRCPEIGGRPPGL
jgi:hypothetical protein